MAHGEWMPAHLGQAGGARGEPDPRPSLSALAEDYVRTHGAGQAEGTREAKRRDLACFLHFYTQCVGHDAARAWETSVTEAFVHALAHGPIPRPCAAGAPPPTRLSPSTVARTYATVRHFARWVHQHVAPFPGGCPTDGVKLPDVAEPQWQGLSHADQHRLLEAAQALRRRKGPGTDHGLRNHALVATLLGSGLRVSELLALDRTQVSDRGFVNVRRKGGHLQPFVPVQRRHRAVLDAWLAARGETPGPLFPTRTGKALSRQDAFAILQRMAREANAHLPPEAHLRVSPQVLRHTLLHTVATEQGVQYALALSGHRSGRYIWRYVPPDAQRLADALDALDEPAGPHPEDPGSDGHAR
jgi:integrase/recombinase XerD